MMIYQWHQLLEMRGIAVRIQSCPIRPLFYEYEVPRIFLIDEKIVRHAEWFFFGLLHKLPIQRHDFLDALRFDEVLSNYLEHKLHVRPFSLTFELLDGPSITGTACA